MSLAHHFPALSHTVNGNRLAFLDSAASAQKPQVVMDSLTRTLTGPYANIHRGLYYNSAETTAAFEAARTTIAQFLGAEERGLVFTRNATEAVNLVAQTWGRKYLKPSDAVVITEIEHHANIVPWQLLQSEIGFSIRVIPLTVLQNASTEALTPYLEGARLLAITQMSNVTGFRPDLAFILPLARSLGLTTLVDGAQGSVHSPQDLGNTPDTPTSRHPTPDFYTATGHKLYGPTGIGILWGRPEILSTMPPYQGGGDMIETVHIPTGTTFAPPPARFEAGTPAIAEAIGLAAAVTFMQSFGWEHIQQHEAHLAKLLTQALEALPFLDVYSPPATGIVAFNIQNAHPADVATLLDQQGVAVRSGHHCAMPYMKALGVTGTLRASLALYSTEDDITQLAAALHKARKMLA